MMVARLEPHVDVFLGVDYEAPFLLCWKKLIQTEKFLEFK